MPEIIKLASQKRGLFTQDETKIYLRPLGFSYRGVNHLNVKHEVDRSLGGGPYYFKSVEVLLRSATKIVIFSGIIDVVREWALNEGCLEEIDNLIFKLTQRRAGIAFNGLTTPLLVGVVNVTPDSFSERTDRSCTSAAVSHAHQLMLEGADVIEIGGESTRPGSTEIDCTEEIDRVLPVIEQCAGFGIPISVDTKKAKVMEVAIQAGGSIINDVTALTGDSDSLSTASRLKVPVVLMHMLGRPAFMQSNPKYDFAPLDVFDYLAHRIHICDNSGIPLSNIIIDPGIGFGKYDEHNTAILARIGLLHSLGVPIMLGVSRKSLIGRLSKGEEVHNRLPGSLALGLAAADQGIHMLRAHDVAETKQAFSLRESVLDAI